MQLRDDLPSIRYPGIWGLFGGHLENQETPIAGLKRELKEEIGYDMASWAKFRCYNEEDVSRYIYHVPLTVEIDRLLLGEGQDMALLTPRAIYEGLYYSQQLKETRRLGKIHRQILLDFIEGGL